MKTLPPADEKDRNLCKERMEKTLHRTQGGRWRVDIIHGRYGWYVRAVRLPKRRKRRCRRSRKA